MQTDCGLAGNKVNDSSIALQTDIPSSGSRFKRPFLGDIVMSVGPEVCNICILNVIMFFGLRELDLN